MILLSDESVQKRSQGPEKAIYAQFPKPGCREPSASRLFAVQAENRAFLYGKVSGMREFVVFCFFQTTKIFKFPIDTAPMLYYD